LGAGVTGPGKKLMGSRRSAITGTAVSKCSMVMNIG
jgi:hypothetical protein